MTGLMIDYIKILLPMMLLRGQLLPEGNWPDITEKKFIVYILGKAEELWAETLETMNFPKPEGEIHDMERAIDFLEREAKQYEWSNPL